MKDLPKYIYGDLEYVNDREQLIRIAEAEAAQKAKNHKYPSEVRKGYKGLNYDHDFETMYFHRAMVRLCKEHGITK